MADTDGTRWTSDNGRLTMPGELQTGELTITNPYILYKICNKL